MTLDRAEMALSRARRDHARAIRALLAAESAAAIKRHRRAATVAERRIWEAKRDLARLACDLAA